MENADPDIIITLIGNKIDMVDKRKVNKEEAENYSNSIGLLYFECSAKSGEGVQDAFIAVMQKIPLHDRDKEIVDDITLTNNRGKEDNKNSDSYGCGSC